MDEIQKQKQKKYEEEANLCGNSSYV